MYKPTTTMTQPDRPKQALQTSPFKLAPRHRFARFFCLLVPVSVMLCVGCSDNDADVSTVPVADSPPPPTPSTQPNLDDATLLSLLNQDSGVSAEPFRPLLDADDAAQRYRAAILLAHNGATDAKTIDVLIAAFQDSSRPIIRQAIFFQGSLYGEKFQRESAMGIPIRSLAAIELERTGSEKALSAIDLAIASEDEDLRLWALRGRAAGPHGARSEAVFLEALSSEDEKLMKIGGEGLAKHGSGKCVDQLLTLWGERGLNASVGQALMGIASRDSQCRNALGDIFLGRRESPIEAAIAGEFLMGAGGHPALAAFFFEESPERYGYLDQVLKCLEDNQVRADSSVEEVLCRPIPDWYFDTWGDGDEDERARRNRVRQGVVALIMTWLGELAPNSNKCKEAMCRNAVAGVDVPEAFARVGADIVPFMIDALVVDNTEDIGRELVPQRVPPADAVLAGLGEAAIEPLVRSAVERFPAVVKKLDDPPTDRGWLADRYWVEFPVARLLWAVQNVESRHSDSLALPDSLLTLLRNRIGHIRHLHNQSPQHLSGRYLTVGPGESVLDRVLARILLANKATAPEALAIYLGACEDATLGGFRSDAKQYLKWGEELGRSVAGIVPVVVPDLSLDMAISSTTGDTAGAAAAPSSSGSSVDVANGEQSENPAMEGSRNEGRGVPTVGPARRRVWTSGVHRVEADFLSFTDGIVRLRRLDDGREIAVSIDVLSAEDQEFIRNGKWKQ